MRKQYNANAVFINAQRKRFKLFSIAGFALLVLIHSSSAENRAGKLFMDQVFAEDEIRVTKDIQYATGAVTQPQTGDKPLFLDIYQPPADPKLPPKLPAFVFKAYAVYSSDRNIWGWATKNHRPKSAVCKGVRPPKSSF